MMTMVRGAVLALFALFSVPVGTAAAAGLGGSLASMRHQHDVAAKNDFTFLRTPADVRAFVEKDRLEVLESNADLLVHDVSFPYARPAVIVFAERLAVQYRAATGDMLVVTSLTRPISEQPRNAHALSVHPTGMAVDLRIPATAAAREWLERTLLTLENKGVLDVTRERNPAHYHVAVFPEKYERYVAKQPPVTPSGPAPPADAHQAAMVAVLRVPELTTTGVVRGWDVVAQGPLEAGLALLAALVLVSGGVGARMLRKRSDTRAGVE